MLGSIDPPLRPRRGGTLSVLAVCRISTEHQDLRSLDDQEALLRRVVADNFAGPVRWETVKSRGSGELLDRVELTRIETALESRGLDLLIVEDLGRICRRTRAFDFCELAEDCDTRVLALNDHVDTHRNGWRMNAFFATIHHELSNKDTADRIRRSLNHRFDQGGVVQCPIYGYIKPPGAKNDKDLVKDPAAGPIYEEWFRRLEDGASFAEIADWLNARGIPTGPYARGEMWTPRMVASVTRNPILKGLRQRNRKVSVRVNKTGRRKSVPAEPGALRTREVLRLAFIDPAWYDRVLALLKARNAKYRSGDGPASPRLNTPRKRTRWPGQHLRCGLCGALCHYGGNGGGDRLVCSGSREYACWNSVTVLGPKAAAKLTAAVLAAIDRLPAFEPTFRELAAQELERARVEQGDRRGELERQHQHITRQIDNLVAGLRDFGSLPELHAELARLKAARDRVAGERAELEGGAHQAIAVPPLAELVEVARVSLTTLAHDSPEFARRMHQLLPRLDIFPYRSLHGGNAVLRAHATLDLVALIPGARCPQGASELLRRELVVDLFDPPQWIAKREDVLRLRSDGTGRTQRQVAAELGISQLAVQKALALSAQMAELGRTDPYVALEGPPSDCKRFRKHRHPRFLARQERATAAPAVGPS